MDKFYKKPIHDEYIKIFNIKEDTYIQTSNLTKKTHYDIQCILTLFNYIITNAYRYNNPVSQKVTTSDLARKNGRQVD